jgi:hypothetical protein
MSGYHWYGSCTTWHPETPPGWAPPVPSVGSQVDAGLGGAGSGRSRITAGAAGPPALKSAAVPARPRRQVPAGGPLLPGVDYPVPQKARRRDDRRDPREKGQARQVAALVRAMTPTRANATRMQIPDLRAALASVRAGVPAGSAAGSAAAGPAGMWALRSAKSA